MRRKPLPPPPDDLADVRDAQAAVPLVPGTEEDCCTRLQRRLGLASRDTAATWLDFLKALDLAEEGPAGFSRSRTDPDDAQIADAFLDTVYGAREALDALSNAAEPLDPEAVAARTRELVSPWERQRHGSDWSAVWERRIRDLLDWLAVLDLVERTREGYTVSRTD